MSMRTEDELQRAHDRLVSLLFDQPLLERVYGPEARGFLIAAADVLCWALHHDHNPNFGRNLEYIERRVAELGIVETESPEYFTGKEPS